MIDKEFMALSAELNALRMSWDIEVAALKDRHSDNFRRMDQLREAMGERAERNIETLARDELWNIYESEGDYDGSELRLCMAATDAGDMRAVRHDEGTLLSHLDPHDYDLMRDGLYADGADDPLIGAYYVIGWDGQGHAFLKSGPFTEAEAKKIGEELMEGSERNG